MPKMQVYWEIEEGWMELSIPLRPNMTEDDLQAIFMKEWGSGIPERYDIECVDGWDFGEFPWQEDGYRLEDVLLIYRRYITLLPTPHDDDDLAEAILRWVMHCGGRKNIREALDGFETAKVWIGGKEEFAQQELENMINPAVWQYFDWETFLDDLCRDRGWQMWDLWSDLIFIARTSNSRSYP